MGDMQDIRDEGLHSLNELKVEYQANFKEKTQILEILNIFLICKKNKWSDL